MTQAYNLSQLANNLNSSGQLDAADGLVNAVPIANGGTGASTAAAARTNLGLVIGTNVPSPTGGGASGTWAISISGNAATATSATSATTATSATSATSATNATNATNATYASNATGTLANQTAKAWVNYNGVAQSIRASFNVSSVTWNGNGDYTVNFSSALADANYAVALALTDGSNGSSGPKILTTGGYDGSMLQYTNTGVRVGANSPYSPSQTTFCVVVYR